jgi:asparagine synthase (glutamine-hydrolysing)
MCGIAGIIDLSGRGRAVSGKAVRCMADAIVHRGPDEDGYLEEPGVGLASRRLSIVGLADGRQPIGNEAGDVWTVYNGELFDYPEQKAVLEGQGHRFRTHCDTELIPHLWEQHGEGMFQHLRGQFALCLYDRRQRRVILGRDRFGICPLYWTIRSGPDGDWLLFASEVKALLASGMVPARPDVRGIHNVFTFFALPGPTTCFEGVRYLPPGRYLDIQWEDADGRTTPVQERIYWEIDFPDAGHEDHGLSDREVVDGFESVFVSAVERRLRADVPVVSYLSGGVDSSVVVAVASKVLGRPIPTFTIQVKDPKLDETGEAGIVARHVGAEPIVVPFGAAETLGTYPELIRAAEGPVIDTSCAALLMLAREVHARGFKVALTGEGSDEWLAGYPWYKVERLMNWLDAVPGLPLSRAVRGTFLRLTGAPRVNKEAYRRTLEAVGGPNAWLNIYGLMSLSRQRFFSKWMWEQLGDHQPFRDIEANLPRLARWHPLNRSLYFGARVHLPGLLLSAKGDRVAMHSSVETRYPFLDLAVYDYLAKLPPRWKYRGLFGDKRVLRAMAQRWLPKSIAWRRKAMFRAPFDSFHLEPSPPFVEQLLSPESLNRTRYFDAESVGRWRRDFRHMRRSASRTTLEMGLVGVLATQMWHHTFIDGSLCELPSWSPGCG